MIKASQSDRRIFEDVIALGQFQKNDFSREIFYHSLSEVCYIPDLAGL